MAKNRSEERQARKERAKAAKEARQAAAEQAQRRRRLKLRSSLALAVATLAIAAVCYWALDSRQLMGITLLIGGVLSLILGLSALASGVAPRDRMRAGSIDYGKRD
jgi:multidrug efflux pump subunit AcrB